MANLKSEPITVHPMVDKPINVAEIMEWIVGLEDYITKWKKIRENAHLPTNLS